MKKLIILVVCSLIAATAIGQDLKPKKGDNKKYGYINSAKELVIDYRFDAAGKFSEGLAPIQLNGKFGYINTKGNIVIDCIYDFAGLFGVPKKGIALIGYINKNYLIKFGAINTNGEVLLECKYNTPGAKFIKDLEDAISNSDAKNTNNNKIEGPANNNSLFSTYAKDYVETKINEWQKKGEFEKTADWQARVNEQTREQKIAEYVKQAEQQFIAERSKEAKNTYTLGEYDADNEVYLVKYDGKDLLVSVPIADAPAFKSGWSSMAKTPKFFIENDRLSVAEVAFSMPNGKTYKYSNAASLNYTVAQVDYNFDPIELDLPTGSNRPAGQQNISTVNVSVGKADVDTDIPQCKRSNDRTFAVIIANENYSKLAKVPFALNDGKTFGEYCRRTLGLPQSNIRFYGDATYGTMLAAVNDIEKIAAAYNGDIRVIFYYAGHGAPNESTQEAFLMPVDAYGVGTEACYSLDRLYNELGALGAKNVTVFLDACFSGSTRDGAMLASARGVAIKPKAVSPHGNMVVFSAASADETALPYNDKGHGLFTYFLLKKLQQSEGNVTFGELGDYITEQVRQKSTVVNRKSQTPTVTVAPTLAQTWKTMCF